MNDLTQRRKDAERRIKFLSVSLRLRVRFLLQGPHTETRRLGGRDEIIPPPCLCGSVWGNSTIAGGWE
jgi:hypothetical protein